MDKSARPNIERGIVDHQIRLLTPGDEPFLWTALYHALHVAPGEDPLPTGVVRHPALACYVEGWMRRSDDLGVAVERVGTPVGAAWLRRWDTEVRGFGFVDSMTPELSMSVLPACRGRGFGTALLRRLSSEASDQFAAVSLSVSASNPARRLYQRFGFVVTGDPNADAITMVKRIARDHAG